MNEWVLSGVLAALLVGMLIGQFLSDYHWRSGATRAARVHSRGRFFWILEEGDVTRLAFLNGMYPPRWVFHRRPDNNQLVLFVCKIDGRNSHFDGKLMACKYTDQWGFFSPGLGALEAHAWTPAPLPPQFKSLPDPDKMRKAA